MHPVLDTGAIAMAHPSEDVAPGETRLALDDSDGEQGPEGPVDKKERLEKKKKMFQVKTKALLGLLQTMNPDAGNQRETAIEMMIEFGIKPPVLPKQKKNDNEEELNEDESAFDGADLNPGYDEDKAEQPANEANGGTNQ